MKLAALLIASVVGVVPGYASEALLDRIDEALTWHSSAGAARARLSGLIDLEGYALPQPLPGVIDANGDALFNPRFTAFLDVQFGSRVYAFAQVRVDRGFDPSNGALRGRLDELAVRWRPNAAHEWYVQAGQFATVVGNWALRHDSWNNPFITAPMPYDNLTGIWDNEPPESTHQLLLWSHVREGMSPAVTTIEKTLRVPVIWGPSYATGLALAGAVGRARFAVEVKNASLSSRPDAWSVREARWRHPTISGRARFLPSETWEFGWSASTGSFLRPLATSYLAPGVSRGQYRQTVLGHDVAYARGHLQLWAEIYVARFQAAPVGNVDTAAYYIEAKYKLTPQFSAAMRWNQQVFSKVEEGMGRVRWGRDAWRIDVAPAYRMNSYMQIKLQYSAQSGEENPDKLAHLAAIQATLRF